jgi:solute:Na+ symporter, SSS family
VNPLLVIGGYLCLLLLLGWVAKMFFRGTSQDYFVASRSIGPFFLLMSVFGTTMTSFALVGSTGKAYTTGIAVYGMLASWSGLVHSAVFFLVGIKLWAIGKRHNFFTQIQFFRARFNNDALGYVLFPILVGLVIPYLLIGLLGAGSLIRGVTADMYPEIFPATGGAVPPWLTGLVISTVVLFYVFFGGLRGAAWANAFQTMVFMATGVVAFYLISKQLGGLQNATAAVVENAPELLARQGKVGHAEFFSYMLIPISVGMFPHIFQHWLTARSARAFRLTVVAHPLFILIVWVPCILIGIWAAGIGAEVPPNAVLGHMVGQLASPFLMGLLTAGVLAAIMSSLDSQFVCIGSMFTHDVVLHRYGENRFTDRQKTWIGRGFVVGIVLVTYLLSLMEPRKVFDLGVWCFTGFTSLFPIVFAALYWKRVTSAGVIASVLVTVILWLALFIRADFGRHEGLLWGFLPVTFVFGGAVLSLVLVSLFTKPPPPELVDQFFPSPRKREAAAPAGALSLDHSHAADQRVMEKRGDRSS